MRCRLIVPFVLSLSKDRPFLRRRQKKERPFDKLRANGYVAADADQWFQVRYVPKPDPWRNGASRRLARPVRADQAARHVAGGVPRAVRAARGAGRGSSGARSLLDPRDRAGGGGIGRAQPMV